MKWSLGEEAAVVPAKCCGSNSTKWWKWWRIMCWQHCASQMEAVPCTEFSFNSLLPMLTLWGVFCVCLFFFQRTCILNTMKATYSVQRCLSASGASVCPWIKWVQIQINSECYLWCSLVHIFLFWLTWFVWDKKLPSAVFLWMLCLVFCCVVF